MAKSTRKTPAQRRASDVASGRLVSRFNSLKRKWKKRGHMPALFFGSDYNRG